MSDIFDRLKKRVELTEFEGYNRIQTRDYQDGKMAGEEKENARLAPIITALIEDNQRLREALRDISEERTNIEFCRPHAHIALAASTKALEEVLDGGGMG